MSGWADSINVENIAANVSAVSQWRPSRTEACVFVGEVLSQLQALANTVATLAELRAVELDSGAVVRHFRRRR